MNIRSIADRPTRPLARRGPAPAVPRAGMADPRRPARSGARRAALTVALLGALLSIAGDAPALGHSPTPAPYGRSWSTSEVAAGSTYGWDSTIPAWLKAPLQDVLEVQWESITSNNSRHISFRRGSGGATVSFSNLTGVTACNNVPGWLGCASGAGSTGWRIWIRRNPNLPWCQLNLVNGCWDVERIAIHEVGHVGGFLDHMDVSQSDTVMTPAPVTRPNFGWNVHHLQRCDEARMLLLYDVASSAGGYPDCFDHIAGHGPTGLYSVVSAEAAQTAECYGAGLTVSGRLAIKSDANYGVLSNNTLSARTVSFDRRLMGTTTWTVDYASTLSDSSSSSNWVKTFSFFSPTRGAITYEYRAHFKGESGVDADYSPTFALTWSNPC
jgi:hypothetical protein